MCNFGMEGLIARLLGGVFLSSLHILLAISLFSPGYQITATGGVYRGELEIQARSHPVQWYKSYYHRFLLIKGGLLWKEYGI